jgi:hypothetical protein
MMMQAAERVERRSWFCSCACFGSSTEVEVVDQEQPVRVEQKQAPLSEKETKERALEAMLRAHPERANLIVHTTSTELDGVRLAEGLKLNTPSHNAYKEKVRTARNIANSIQAEQAGVSATDWPVIHGSADARARRHVIHRATVLERQALSTHAEIRAAQEAAAKEAASTDAALKQRTSSATITSHTSAITDPAQIPGVPDEA